MRLTIIILNYAHPENTLNCIASLKKSKLPEKTKIVVVDNAPVINNTFKKLHPDIDYIKTKKNLGFAGGNNIGIKKALKEESEYILITNPDVIYESLTVDRLLQSIEVLPFAGIVAPAHRHKQKNFTKYGLNGIIDWRTTKSTHINVDKLSSKKPVLSDFVSFACVLIDAKVFREVGLIDDYYFMYFEDVDFCIQAQRLGYLSYLIPAALIDHKTSASFKKPTDKIKFSFVSKLKFINKWLDFPYNILPYLRAFTFFPYLYLLWTYHAWKYPNKGL